MAMVEELLDKWWNQFSGKLRDFLALIPVDESRDIPTRRFSDIMHADARQLRLNLLSQCISRADTLSKLQGSIEHSFQNATHLYLRARLLQNSLISEMDQLKEDRGTLKQHERDLAIREKDLLCREEKVAARETELELPLPRSFKGLSSLLKEKTGR